MALKTIRLRDVRCFDSFSQAPDGCIVQFREQDDVFVGMKISFQVANGIASAALVLEEDKQGLMIDSSLILSQVIDITLLVELYAVGPCHKAKMSGVPQKGAIYRDLQHPGSFWVYGTLNNSISKYVCVSSSDTAMSVGTSLPTLAKSAVLVAIAIGCRESGA